MKIFKKNSTLSGLFVSFVLLAVAFAQPMSAVAATTPSLGAATSYAILASTYTNTSAGTTVNGDIGFTTGPAVHPLGTQSRYGSSAPYAIAGADQGSALSSLAAQACDFTFAPGAVDLTTSVEAHPGSLGVYPPGVYCTSGAGAMNVSGTLTLNGAGTYIFRAVGALTTSAGAIVALAGGASPCNVFWTATQATTLAANTTFQGTVIDDSGITIGAVTNWTGRALAFGGTVTTNTDVINVPGACSGNPPLGPTSPIVVPPIIDVVKVPAPLALPSGPGSVTYTYRVRNIGTVPMTTVTMVDDSCNPVMFVSGDTDGNSVLDLTETWIYTCTTTLNATHTNTVVATGYWLGASSTDIASATVVVGALVVPPLIHVTKIPNPIVLPVGGGLVSYAYAITNPGTVPLNNVTIVDNMCSPVAGRSGDTNNNNILEVSETWNYTCLMNLATTMTNTVVVTGQANGFTATDVAIVTVAVPGIAPIVVIAPPLPAAGVGPQNTGWNIVIMASVLIIASISVIVLKKNSI